MPSKIRIGKVFLVIFNIVYTVLATGILVFGIFFARKHYTLIQKLKKYDKITGKLIVTLDYAITGDDLLCIVLLVTGSTAVFLILFNFFSMYTRNTHRLRILGFTLTMLCAIKLTVGCLFILTTQYAVEVKTNLQKNFNHYVENERCRAAQIFIEEQHNCCGIDEPNDYIHLNLTGYPMSCYRSDSNLTETLKREGCAEKISDYYIARITDIGLVCLLVGSLEVFGPISTFYLVNAMKMSTPIPV